MTARIFYGDGVEYEGDDPPARDVQVILQHDNAGPYFQSGSDYYVKQADRWQGVDIFGLFDYLLDSGFVLFGRTIGRDEYNEIYQRSKVVKNTWRPGERRP